MANHKKPKKPKLGATARKGAPRARKLNPIKRDPNKWSPEVAKIIVDALDLGCPIPYTVPLARLHILE